MTVEFKYDHNGLRTQKKVTSGSEGNDDGIHAAWQAADASDQGRR